MSGAPDALVHKTLLVRYEDPHMDSMFLFDTFYTFEKLQFNNSERVAK